MYTRIDFGTAAQNINDSNLAVAICKCPHGKEPW